MTGHELHITLRRFDVPVAEQPLNTSNIHATHDPLRGPKVTQVVKPDPLQSGFPPPLEERMTRIPDRLFRFRPHKHERTSFYAWHHAKQFERVIRKRNVSRLAGF